MAIDNQTLSVAKKYTQESLEGAGALKGKDGESAYRIALNNGFVGSQEEWLESLNGKDGEDGTDGFSPIITENKDNTDTVYKLDITDVNHTFTTPNLKGKDGSGESGTSDYNDLENKPKINNVVVDGERSLEDYGIQPKGDYSLVNNTGYELGLSINPVDYVMTVELKNNKGEVLSNKTIDFPLESMVVSASYFDGQLILSLQNGQTLDPIDISSIVNGLVPDGRTIAGIDLKNDISSDVLKNALNVKNGVPYTPVIGTVQKGDEAQASVDNEPEELISKFNFTLPKGDKGDKGDTPYIKNGTWWYGDTDSGVPIPSFLDLLKYIDESYGIQDTPIGHIINHMGNNAPRHYLKCDGAIYNIGTYPYLEEHFRKEFGQVDYFGGNEVEGTYAVPNLQGEFLRGTGTTLYADSGNGADVGVHQSATLIPAFGLNNTTNKLYLNSKSSTEANTYTANVNPDVKITRSEKQAILNNAFTESTYTGINPYAYYSTRPSNTSVLYCIKYEPTYFMVINGET